MTSTFFKNFNDNSNNSAIFLKEIEQKHSFTFKIILNSTWGWILYAVANTAFSVNSAFLLLSRFEKKYM